MLAEREELARALAPWRRRLRYQSIATWTAGGAAVGLALAALIGLAARLTPLPGVPVVALVGLVVLAGALNGLGRTPSLYQTARRVDRALGLADRLATAWEATGESWPLARLQWGDTLASLAGRHPVRDLPLRVPRRTLATLGAAAAAALLVWALPNPMHEVLRQREEARARVAEAMEKTKEAERLAEEAAALAPEERQAIQQVLDELERALARAQHEHEALAALSAAEDRLRALSDPEAREQAAALSALARSLAREALTAAAGEAIGRGDAEAARQAIAELAQALAGLNQEERRQLAQALQAAANEVAASARGQTALSGALRQAARAVAGGDVAGGSEALAGLADEVAGLQDGVARQEQRGRIGQAVRGARETMAGPAPAGQPAAAGAGQREGTDASPGPGAGQGPGQGAGEGQGAGSSGRAGEGGGRGGREGGIGPGGAALGREAEQLAGDGETLFVPGRDGAGPNEEATFTTEPAAGSVRPYREVLGQYAAAARDHLERSAIPPALKETVRQYFADMEGR